MAAYVLAQLRVHDPTTFQHYREKVAPLIERFGGRYIVRGGEVSPLEGQVADPRLVIIEFADRDAARRWYESEAYQEILPLRLNAASGSVVIVDGV